METKKLFNLLIALPVFALISCSDDEVDLRANFEGSYEMEDFDVDLTDTEGELDTTITVETNPDIEFVRDPELHPDEIRLDLETFMDDMLNNTLGNLYSSASFTVDIEDEFVTMVEGTEFDLGSKHFKVNLQEGSLNTDLICTLEADGEVTEDQISMDYKVIMYITENNFTFSGSAEGEED